MPRPLARRSPSARTSPPRVWNKSFADVLFPEKLTLLPQVSQRYEFELAYGESQILSDSELVERSAYFYKVNGRTTNHYRICQRRPVQVDPDLKHRQNFFDANAYGVGYATHGLFPYRGKFHPQMIKGIMNIVGLKRGDVVLDPMCGCGTTLIEASLIGVDSIGVELNPFACLISRAKLSGLNMDCAPFTQLVTEADRIFSHFQSERRAPESLFDFGPSDDVRTRVSALDQSSELKELVLLAFLDTMGYATRRKTKTARQLFPIVLTRYLAAVQQFNLVREELGLSLGTAQIRCDDARRLPLRDSSVDGVIFSPPYSFAIDYVANDELQLRYLGYDPRGLSECMVGLIGGTGRTLQERITRRVQRYFQDMNTIIDECSRVMKRGACCVVVLGSNTNQTGGIALEGKIMEFAGAHGMPLHFHITREIEGIRNTMRDEHILIFRKP